MPKPNQPVVTAEVIPDPGLEKRVRRSFSVDYKLKILSLAEQCAHGELGALLRREKLYSNQLQQWRREFSEQGVAGLSKTAPGPKAQHSPEQKELEKLRRENQRLQRELLIANDCLDLQKKALAMRDLAKNGGEG